MLVACLAAILGVLFYKSLLPQYVLHNNDAPLGALFQASNKMPDAFYGKWLDLNWLGAETPSASPSASVFFVWFAGNLAYAKFWTPLAQIILGLSAWLLFRRLKFSAFACVLGGLAAALHSDFFSNACWGQQSRPLALADMLLALAALQEQGGARSWLKALIAGLCVGWGIMEGFDIAALFSLVVAAYVMAQAWAAEGGAVKRISRGVLRVALVAGFSALVAAQFIIGLVGTQIKGVAGAQQDEKTKAERWAWATQWSLPKAEALGALVPGLFGFRMDSPDGGQYWGACGRDLAWDEYFASGQQGAPPQGFIRYGGAGNYSGPMILALALWAVLQSFRRKDSPFAPAEKKMIWFWAALSAVCLLLAWGRWAPFYQFFYMLPYASTIRNPGKFFHIVDWAWLMLFAYGVHALGRQYWESRSVATGQQKKNWWLTAQSLERKWVVGSVIAAGLAVVGWGIYSASGANLVRYLQEVQFDEGTARLIAKFSTRQVGWFVLTLTAALGVVALIITGRLAGPRAKLGAILLGAVLVVDLSLANLPFIVHWNWRQKYATNPIIERLRERPYEQRVVGLPHWLLPAFRFPEQLVGLEQYFDQLYRSEWAQHHFPYYDIQSLDVVQMSRASEDYVAYEGALQVHSPQTLPLLTRKWELANTRYILAHGAFVDFFNNQFDPGKGRFRIAERFDIRPKENVLQPRNFADLTAVPATNGNYALIEFTGALPRAKLYSQWQVSTNDQETLKALADPAFDPAQKVLVTDLIAVSNATTNQDLGSVEFVSYRPKHITLQAKTEIPAVLLLNDHYAPNWQAWVDGKQEKLLRCNYIMRGVLCAPGAHKVEFVFKPDNRPFHVTCGAMGAGVVIGLGLLIFRKRGVITA